MSLKMTLKRLILQTNVVGDLIEPLFSFYTLKHKKARDFLIFSTGIEKRHQNVLKWLKTAY